jgi:hypothetical protein
MPNINSTVYLKPHEEYDNFIYMIWNNNPKIPDVQATFKQLRNFVEQSLDPVYVIVDIQSSPKFPLGSTISGAASVHINHNLNAWLVIGSSSLAKVIGKAISSAGKAQIVWFKTEQDLNAYVEEIMKGVLV